MQRPQNEVWQGIRRLEQLEDITRPCFSSKSWPTCTAKDKHGVRESSAKEFFFLAKMAFSRWKNLEQPSSIYLSIYLLERLIYDASDCCVERTPKGEWLLAVLPADCKLSWKKLRAIHGKGTRIATEEAHHFGSVAVVVTVSCHLSKILVKLFDASTSIIYCTLYPPRRRMTKSVYFSYWMSHCIAIYRDEHVHWFFHSGGHRSHWVLAGSRSTSCCSFCFQGGHGFCH